MLEHFYSLTPTIHVHRDGIVPLECVSRVSVPWSLTSKHCTPVVRAHSQALASSVWAVAKLQLEPEGTWTQGVVDNISSKLPMFSPQVGADGVQMVFKRVKSDAWSIVRVQGSLICCSARHVFPNIIH